MSQIDLIVAASAPQRAERRKSPRRRVFLRGKVVLANTHFSSDCTIRDLSPTGARIRVNPDTISIDPYHLIVVKDGVVHASTTAWQTGDEVGLEFDSTDSLSGDTPPHLRQLHRLWVELMPR
jgi:hypothetical protein